MTKQRLCDTLIVDKFLEEKEVISMRVEKKEIVIAYSMMTSVSAF